MRRATLVPTFVLLGLLLPSTNASASGFLEWLERLSGPGPFVGGGVEVPFYCYGLQLGRDGAPLRQGEDWFPDYECRNASRTARRIALGARVAWLTGENDLDYEQPLPKGARNVRIFRLDAFGDYSLNATFDVGVGLGLMRFTGMPADAFSKFVFQPIRFTWKPLTMGKTVSAQRVAEREFLQIRYVATLVPGGFDDEDFGARPGTRLTGGTEFLSTLNVLFSF